MMKGEHSGVLEKSAEDVVGALWRRVASSKERFVILPPRGFSDLRDA